MAERKRHFYSACDGSGETVSWQTEWYTASWYTESQDVFDMQASTGAVNPPTSVYALDPACSALLSSVAVQGVGTLPVTLTPTSNVPTVATGTALGTAPATRNTATRTSFPSPSKTLNVSASDPRNTSQPVPFAAAVTDPSAITTCSGRGIDYQAWGAIASLVLGLIVGVIVWYIWWMLKKKRNLVGVFSPREWFLGKRPLTSRKEFWTTLKHPSFNWLVEAPTNMVKSVSEATLVSVAFLAIFKVLAWSTIAIVALALPLFIVIQPCIELTSPKSTYGGRLGTMTDLSILRLLNALDPDPAYFIPRPGQAPGHVRRDLPSTIRPATSTAHTRLIVLVSLCSAIIFFPSILFLARCLRSLIAFRTHWYKEVCEGEEMAFLPWKKDLRYGAPTTAPTEQEVRKLASDLKLWDDGHSADAEENDERAKRRTTIRAVFAVPDTTSLRNLLNKRTEVLEKLEVAETKYIRSFKANFPQPEKPAVSQVEDNGNLQVVREAVDRSMGILSPGQRRRLSSSNIQKRPRSAEDAAASTSGYILPRNYYKINDLPTIPSRGADNTKASSMNSQHVRGRKPTFHEEVQGGITGSQFQEVYRDSLMPDGRRPPVGTPLAMEKGKFSVRRPNSTEKALPPPPTESAITEAFLTADVGDPSSPRASSIGHGNGTRRSRITFVTDSAGPRNDQSPISTEYPRWSNNSLPSEALLPIPILEQPLQPRPKGGSEPPLRPISGVSPDDIGETYTDIREHRARLMELNGQVAEAQAITYEHMVEGKKVLGYMLIGRSVTKIPGSIPVKGMSRDDVRWSRLEKVKQNNSMMFWILWLASTVVAAICMVPFIGLANSAAPGLSHYLGLLKPIARSNGLGSGIIQSVVPAIGGALILWGLKHVIHAISTRDISKTSQEYRTMKAMCLSSVLLVVWLVAASAVICAVQAFDDGVQITRFVGDGAVYSCWWLFCVLLNLAIFVPGCLLLRAGAAYGHARLHRKVETPRQRFQAFFPSRTALPTLAAACVFFIALSFPLLPLFPLMGLPALLFLGLLFLASRFLATYTDCNLHGRSGGLLAIGLLWILGWTLCLQPLLLGLVLLSRREWQIGGASVGVAFAGLIVFEVLARSKCRRRRINGEDRDRLQSFAQRLKKETVELVDDGTPEPESDLPASDNIRRRSNATIFELMSDLLIPTERRRSRGALPLQTEHINDLLEPYRANLAHPDIHQNAHEIPPLSLRSTDGFDMVRYQAEHTMYPGELIMPAPVVWLPDDKVDIGKQEVQDLMRFYRLPAMLDAVRS